MGNSSELLAKTRERGLVGLVTYMMVAPANVHDVFAPDIVNAVAEGFAALADNEDFQPDWQSFFPGDEKSTFLMLEDKLIKGIIDENPTRKRELRPLLDFFAKIKRSA